MKTQPQMGQLLNRRQPFQWAVTGAPCSFTKSISPLALLAALFFTALSALPAQAAEDGVALAIVYDTSGSMKEQVPDASGGFSPKYVIANRALLAVTRQLEAYATNTTSAPRNVQVGLFIFDKEHAREVVKLGPLDAKGIERWAQRFSSPHGNTPLGNALHTATRAVLESPLKHKHVLIITDGLNTAGPSPREVLPKLKHQADEQKTGFSVHFVAFDVDARQFAPLKRLGATVVGAADEKQLNSQLQFILQQKILLEDEEPPKPR